MKKFYSFSYLVFSLIAFFACTSDGVNQECVTCDVTATEYCIIQGEDFYTITENESATVVPLDGQFWSDIKNTIEFECGADCFICNDSETTYCYIEGNDFYTIRIEGLNSQVFLLEGNTWEELKEEFAESCTDATTDCYTCESTSTEYCYTEEEDHYTATVDGNETIIPLDGQTWDEIKNTLILNCPGNLSGIIVGNWLLVDYTLSTVTTTTTIDGIDVITTSESVGVTYNSTELYTEGPNESFGNGISFLVTTVTDENGEEEIFTDVELEILDSSSWEVNGNQLTKIVDGESGTAELLILSDTMLRYKSDITIETVDFDDNPQTINFTSVSTFIRQ